ncbi:MAG TPA: GyrI-like domain-containing protein [Silvibacterium sp.]|nr:GyrI-like domain-containing protein [Silvibacterium sp.]
MRIQSAIIAFALSLAATPFLSTPALAQAQAGASPVTAESQPGFTVVGVSVRTDNQKEAGGTGLIPQMWQKAMQEGVLENIPHRADNNLTVVYTDYGGTQSGEYTYVLGVRVTSVDKVPQGMVEVNVPAGKYAVVQSEKGPLPEVLPKVWQRISAMTPAELGGQRAFKADYEVYPEGFNWQDAQIPVYIGLK